MTGVGWSIDPPPLWDYPLWDFLSLCMQIWSKMQHKSCSPLCGILLPFSPAYAHKWRGWGEGGNCPSRAGGRRGFPPPTTVFFLCSSICTWKFGLICSEMLLPANFVWNFVAFAHLRYLKIVLRSCVQGQAWVRVGVSKLRCDCS